MKEITVTAETTRLEDVLNFIDREFGKRAIAQSRCVPKLLSRFEENICQYCSVCLSS